MNSLKKKLEIRFTEILFDQRKYSLPADLLWGSFVTHS